MVCLLVTFVPLVVRQELFQHAHCNDVGQRNDRGQRIVGANGWNPLQNGSYRVEGI